MTTAFVLGGGGVLGAHEVGMLRARLPGVLVDDEVSGRGEAGRDAAQRGAVPAVGPQAQAQSASRAVSAAGADSGAASGPVRPCRTASHAGSR